MSVWTLRAQLLCEFLMDVNVDFRDTGIGFDSQRLDRCLEHLIGALPVGMTVDENDLMLVDDLVEVGCSFDGDRFRGILHRAVVSIQFIAVLEALLQFSFHLLLDLGSFVV